MEGRKSKKRRRSKIINPNQIIGNKMIAKEVIELEEGWKFIEGEISKVKRIMHGSPEKFNAIDRITLHTKIYDMCMQKPPLDYAGELFLRYVDLWDDYVSNTVIPSLCDLQDEFLLRELMKRWADHKIMNRWLYHFFAYLDSYHDKVTKSIEEVGNSSFVEKAFETYYKKAIRYVLELMNREREGEYIDRSLLKNILDMFADVGMRYYRDGFESLMLEDATVYYSNKAAIWIEGSFPDYMSKAEECLKLVKEKASHYLSLWTQKKLLDEVLNQLLSPQIGIMLLENEQSGCLALIKNEKIDDLSRMYCLFSKTKTTQVLDFAARIFQQHVTDEGMALVKQAEEAAASAQKTTEKRDQMAALHEQNFIWKVIELLNKYLAYVGSNGCFHNSSIFHKALNESFQVFCNKTIAGNCTAEILCNFCDKLFRKGGVDKLSHEVIETTIEKVVYILLYINDKDLFAEFYRKKLGRRLLFDMSENDEHERNMVLKLKQQFGKQFTSKMEGMVTDMALAKDKLATFKNYIDKNNSKVNTAGIDLNVTVLTTGFWPTYKSHDVNLPQEMAKCVEVFKEFYQTQTKHRKLSWVYSMGTCTIIGKFEKKPIELVVNTYQACALMLFNSSDQLSCSEIVTQLNLLEDDVVRLLQSLSCGKYKILTKEPNTKTISLTDIFNFNSKFTDKMRRIKIPLPPQDEKSKVIQEVKNDRRYTIDAALVRIMKSRKVLDYQQLVAACVEQLSSNFKPDIRVIKKRIEDLISRDYLARDADNFNVYKYVA